jgi:hypothetical protein
LASHQPPTLESASAMMASMHPTSSIKRLPVIRSMHTVLH